MAFNRAIREFPEPEARLWAFLARAYPMKAVAIHGTGPRITVTKERADSAIRTARSFVHHIDLLLKSD